MEKIKNGVIKETKKNLGSITKKADSGKSKLSETKEWKYVCTMCSLLFHGDKISPNEFSKVYASIRTSSHDILSGIDDVILKRGMESFRKEVKEKPGHAFLLKISEIWTNFYQLITPTLQIWFSDVPMHGVSLNHMIMLNFRDNFILRLKIDEALSANDLSLPKEIKQMFLVTLQAVQDYSDNYYKLEGLTARVVSPFLGTKGLYVRSETKELVERKPNKPIPPPITTPPITTPYAQNEYRKDYSERQAELEFEELLNYRQRVKHDTKQTEEISESLASLLADGFEMA